MFLNLLRRSCLETPTFRVALLVRRSLSTNIDAAPRQSARSPDTPFRMAVVGSGPAGFYTSYRVLSQIRGAKVDMYESLPVPYGLVRHGVAPDHPEVKVRSHS